MNKYNSKIPKDINLPFFAFLKFLKLKYARWILALINLLCLTDRRPSGELLSFYVQFRKNRLWYGILCHSLPILSYLTGDILWIINWNRVLLAVNEIHWGNYEHALMCSFKYITKAYLKLSISLAHRFCTVFRFFR